MKTRPVAIILLGLIVVAGLLVVAEEVGGPSPVQVHVDKTHVSPDEKISGAAVTDGDPDVVVRVIVDGQVVATDDSTPPGNGEYNEFEFDVEAEWVGKQVKVEATDGSGNSTSVSVTVQ